MNIRTTLQADSDSRCQSASSQLDTLFERKLARIAEVVVTSILWANKSCELDPLPTRLLKECTDVLAPSKTSIVNAHIGESHVLKKKQEHIRSLLKKHGRCIKKLQTHF